jgi:hypothetical protein
VSQSKKTSRHSMQCACPGCSVICDPSEYCDSCQRYICHEHRLVDDLFEEGHDVDSHWVDYGVVEFES